MAPRASPHSSRSASPSSPDGDGRRSPRRGEIYLAPTTTDVRAAVLQRVGGPEQLVVQDVPEPEAGDGQVVVEGGVTILGPTNLPSTVPYHASQMYSKNITTFLLHLANKEGQMNWDLTDEITRETLVTHKGEVVHERVRGLVLASA